MQSHFTSSDSHPSVDTDRSAMTTRGIFDSETVAPLWTTKDLAKFLGCSERQIPRLRDEGLPAVRVGGLVRFMPSRVMAWLDSRDEHAREFPPPPLTDFRRRSGCAGGGSLEAANSTNQQHTSLP